MNPYLSLLSGIPSVAAFAGAHTLSEMGALSGGAITDYTPSGISLLKVLILRACVAPKTNAIT